VTLKVRIHILFGIVFGLCMVSFIMPSQAYCDEQKDPESNSADTIKQPPPPGMPNMQPGVPNMPPRGMGGPPKFKPGKSKPANDDLEVLAEKPFRPSWAPLTIFRGDTQAAGYLLPVCTSKNATNRAKAAFILGQIGDKTAIKTLRKLLQDTEPEVRMQAAVALGEMEDGTGISVISHLFDSSQPWVRVYAVHALWNIHTKYARSVLLDRKKNQPPMVADIITRAANTTYTRYPTVKPGKTNGKKVIAKPGDMWFQASGLLVKESDYWWHKGKYNEINRCLEAAVFLDPSDVESYSVIAWLEWSMGQDARAIQTLNRCIAENPKSPEAFSELGYYYTRSKRWALAEWPLKNAVELGGDVLIRKSYAHCLEKLGKIEEAKEIWTKLKKEFPKDGAIDHNYKRIMGQTGQPV